jgi:hypothetical protein
VSAGGSPAYARMRNANWLDVVASVAKPENLTAAT